jgi:hypothetical protein
MTRHTNFRALHDLGLATWYGGTLANAVALNPAAGQAGLSSRTGAVANVGWDRWTPVNAAAVAAHVVGSAGMLATDLPRLTTQRGVASMAVAKTGLTIAALGATAYSRVLGKKVSQRTDVPAASGTEPAPTTPDDVAAAQRQLRVLQWVVPALTGGLVVLSAFAGEQQRATEAHKGFAARLLG